MFVLIHEILFIMKKIILLAATLLFINQINAQQWPGVTTSAGYIYRTGNVSIGGAATATATTLPFTVNASATAGTKIAFGANALRTTTFPANASVLEIQSNILTGESHLNLSSGTTTNTTFMDFVSNKNLNFNGIVNSGFAVPFVIQNGGAERLRLTSDGLVGIGNTAPKSKFQVGTSNTSVSIGDYPYTAGKMTNYLGFNAARNSAGVWNFEVATSNNGGSAIVNDATGNLSFVTIPNSGTALQTKTDADMFNARRMTIRNNGKIVMGENVPSLPGNYRLYVQDGILTEKVKVALKSSAQWADFVFDKNYQLKSLTEVEQYVKKNHHLEGIPSAKEVLENGVELLEMNAKLLQKIEELTLYTIELNKQNKVMQDRLKAVENSIKKDRQ
jgi:trimeric autotransporter adhesin